MSIFRSRLLRVMLFALVLGMILAACGSDGTDTDDSSGQAGAQIAPTAQPMLPDPTAAEDVIAAGEATSDPGVTPDPSVTAEATTEVPAAAPEPTSTPEPQPTAATEPEPTPTPEPEPAEEPDNPAPELGSIDSWHNSPALSLVELRGAPVLLVFWADY